MLGRCHCEIRTLNGLNRSLVPSFSFHYGAIMFSSNGLADRGVKPPSPVQCLSIAPLPLNEGIP